MKSGDSAHDLDGFGFWADDGLTGSYPDSDGWAWKVATSQSTCLISRITGQVVYKSFTCPVSAMDIEEQRRKAEAGSVAKPGWRAGYFGVFDLRPRFQRDPYFFSQALRLPCSLTGRAELGCPIGIAKLIVGGSQSEISVLKYHRQCHITFV
jgi:hypothetical protein